MSTPDLEFNREVSPNADRRTQGSISRPLDVLLIEDNPDDALLLERHLRRNGFEPQIVRVETSPAMYDALSCLPPVSETPRVVLADYNLPTFSGPEALGMLKASGIDIPFIMLSGAVSEEAAVESMRAGAQDYVTKQNLTRLVPAIERELKEAAARRNRVTAELALRESESRFHRLVEAMPLGLLISEASGGIVYANNAVERMLGYKAAAVSTGSSAAVNALTLNSICPTLQSTMAEVQLDGSAPTAPFEAVCITVDGQKIDVLIGMAFLNPEQPAERQQVAAFIADLTLQKKSEEVLRQTEKLAVAGRFAAAIAHDINNPLEAITNCLYLMSQGNLDADARSYLNMAQNELNMVSKVTMQTLRFYRSSTRPHLTDVHDLIASVISLLEQRFKQQEIGVEQRRREIPLVLVHDGEIRQVLANLVSNAIDALSFGGRLILRTSATRHPKHGAGVRITVADNGIGMDGETRQRIFDAFYSTKGITGTGLGLWISSEIVRKHGGRLLVRSRKRTDETPGGTVFSFFVPVEKAPEQD